MAERFDEPPRPDPIVDFGPKILGDDDAKSSKSGAISQDLSSTAVLVLTYARIHRISRESCTQSIE